MSYTPDTSIANLSDWNFYAKGCEEKRASGLPQSPETADEVWRMIPPDMKNEYRDQSYEPLDLLQTKPWDYPYGVDGLVDNVVRLDSTSVKQESRSPPPLYSESESTAGSSAFDRFPTPGPSTFDQVYSPGPYSAVYGSPFPSSLYTSEVPTHGPSSHMDQPPFPVAGPSSPLPAPAPSYPVDFRGYTSPDGTDSPPFDEATSNHLGWPQNPPPPRDWFDHIYGGAPNSSMIPVGIDESGPTAVPLTSTTGYYTNGLATPIFTSGSYTHDLPAELDNNQWTGLPQQPIWNFGEGSGCVDQQSILFPSSDFAAVTPVPPFPVDHHSVSPDDRKFWSPIAKTLESDQPQAAPAPIPQQDIPFPTPRPTTVQHTFTLQYSGSVVRPGGAGQDGTPVQIEMPKVNITFTTEQKP